MKFIDTVATKRRIIRLQGADPKGGKGRPFDSRNGGMSGTEVKQFTVGMDAILTF